MNIFMLHYDTEHCAQMHCDKHINKMLVEYGQMLSTAHRMLDGTLYIEKVKGRRIKRWLHDNDLLYKATHVNHPSNIWTRESSQNYDWLYSLFKACYVERHHRYGKGHGTWDKLGEFLASAPKNIPHTGVTDLPLCMPDKYKVACPVESYRNFYRGDKREFATWKNRETPEWFNG